VRSLRVFKHGVSLLAEDPVNAGAGRLLLDCGALDATAADDVWGRALVFAVSGSAGDELHPHINGVVATLKRAPSLPLHKVEAKAKDHYVRVEVWLHSDAAAAAAPSLIQRLTEALRGFLRVNVPITYQPHQQDTAK
jgi:hypothetical protein